MADPDLVLRTGTERVVFDLLRATGATTSQEPIRGLSSFTRTVPADWTDGIRAARTVAAAARGLMYDYARRARGAGLSWRQLADPLGVLGDEDIDPAAAAFELIAGPPAYRFDQVTTAWRCASCDAYVTDTGPDNGHPADCERGHAAGCARHRREIRAYERRQ